MTTAPTLTTPLCLRLPLARAGSTWSQWAHTGVSFEADGQSFHEFAPLPECRSSNHWENHLCLSDDEVVEAVR